ncbi:hypothetical protein [Neobacillus sp. D3-1R]|uniref:hypothetical protein n=1 Tax=Neobacillus sp. D3-1R TaxID=3445778 RepID=UPI003F9FFC74
MSFPNIPNVTPSINLSRNDVINLLLASIAFEELGLAHIINAEAEKIQAVVGTLPNSDLAATSIDELLSINKSVNDVLKTVIKKEMLLQFKLEDILNIPPGPTPQPEIEIFENTATVTAFFDGVGVTDSDNAFYHILVA